jgi:cytochrome oxidase Cu insertion factor (SCO1/SenC/PrrC family)
MGALALLTGPTLVQAHEAAHETEQRLPIIGAAPDFALTSQDGAEVTLAALRGKVVAVTFIYASCLDVCPLLTDKMARVQDELGVLTGEPGRVIEVAHRYGVAVVSKRTATGACSGEALAVGDRVLA